MTTSFQIAAQAEREILVTRTFAADVERVFAHLTKADLLRRWLGARAGWRMTTCDVDLRPHGTYRYVWQGPTGEMGMGGTFLAVDAPRRLVCDEVFDVAWYPGKCVHTTEILAEDNACLMRLTLRYDTQHVRDMILGSPMPAGMEESYAVLDRVLHNGDHPTTEVATP